MSDCHTPDHHIMHGMALDFRQQAAKVTDLERRSLLLDLADYCQRMSLAMQRRLTQASSPLPARNARSTA